MAEFLLTSFPMRAI